MLKEKKAIVTGASRGIGAAIAKALSQNGAEVAIIYNGSEAKAEEVSSEISASGGVSKIYKCNVADSAQCADTVKEILEDFGKIDILVNNAGIVRDNLLARMSDEDFDAVINTNLKGCFNMIKACSRNFIRNKGGKIINISSVSALLGTAGQANYAASKAGIIALTKTAAREFAGKNICCNAIAPGFVVTDMTESLDQERYLDLIPLKRPGQPQDIANAAVFLASDMASYITGEVLRVDGGLAI